jgi:hypothetical protein
MYVEKALLNHLLAQTGLTALVADRIYSVWGEQETEEPYIVFFKVSGQRVNSHNGFSHLVNAAYQCSVFSKDLLKAQQIVAQLNLALDGQHGVVGTSGEDTGVFMDITHENDQELYENGTGFYNFPVDYLIKYQEE